MKFKRADESFDVERFKAAVRIFITAQEIIVDNASYPIKEIAENSHIFRTLGLGFAKPGRAHHELWPGLRHRRRARACGGHYVHHDRSCLRAKRAARAGRRAVPGYHDTRASGVKQTVDKTNAPSMLEVIGQHRDAVAAIQPSDRFAYLKDEALKCWDGALALGKKHGYRNAQVTVLAPTGTIGFLMDCDTTGIEPDIALVKYKLLAGGGMLKIVNQTVKPALRNLGYEPAQIERIIAHIDKFDTIEDVTDEDGTTVPSGLKPEDLPVFDCAFKPHKGTRSLHYRGHIRMMAAAQPFLSGAISKTVNLPENATVEDIMNTYIEGWKLGLKAIAIYRDGSKRSAPLNVKKTKDMGGTDTVADVDSVIASKQQLEGRIVELETEMTALRARADVPPRRRMPETRLAMNHKFEIAGHKGYLTVGMFEDGNPGEIFIQMNKEGSTIGGLMDTVATLTSLSLQFGVPLESLVKKFAYQRFEPSGFTKNPDIRNATSITDYVFRWLGCQFIKGYKEATSPNRGQTDLPMRELSEIDKKGLNRPVSDLRASVPTSSTYSRTRTAAKASRTSRAMATPTPTRCRKRWVICIWTSPAQTAARAKSFAPAPAAAAPNAARARAARKINLSPNLNAPMSDKTTSSENPQDEGSGPILAD
jgi:ribonucleoside-diphosphate reductase alpha chain